MIFYNSSDLKSKSLNKPKKNKLVYSETFTSPVHSKWYQETINAKPKIALDKLPDSMPLKKLKDKYFL
jgi:hypothetical protein